MIYLRGADKPIGPVCHLLGRWHRSKTAGPEARVVAAVVGRLVEVGYGVADIHLEYRLSPGNRVDVVLPDADRPLLFECKPVRIIRSNLKQAERYLSAARLRWPDRDPLVVLVAPDRDETIVPPPGIEIIRVAAAAL